MYVGILRIRSCLGYLCKDSVYSVVEYDSIFLFFYTEWYWA